MAKKDTREIHTPSPTAIVAEALRTGVAPKPKTPIPPIEITQQQRVLQVGDPDDSALNNAYVGDETPGGSMPTPDQDRVDDIRRAYGRSGGRQRRAARHFGDPGCARSASAPARGAGEGMIQPAVIKEPFSCPAKP